MGRVSEDRDNKGRFVVGWKGGPGRPKGTFTSLTSILRNVLEGTELGGQKTPDDRMVAEWFVDHVVGHAMNGNASIIKEILDRIDGKIPDPVDTPAVTMESVAEMEELDARLDGDAEAPADAGQVP